MNYQVVWQPAAEDQLAEAWVNASDRKAVNAAAERIEQLLSLSPLDQGESRDPRCRILFVQPLGVVFEVDHKSKIVTILAVRIRERA